ncbi:MAG: DUF485 domain-containing protein [Pirellulales bacterium]
MHWDHGKTPDEGNHPRTAARNARWGMVLFVLYLVGYAGFVLAGAFAPAWLAQRPWAGVNLAIWYGFGLIVAALAVALVYSWLCRARDAS